jgi:CheY-like chemotaxis protein
MAQSRGVALTVETELSSRPSFVVGSDAGLRTALTNLILNGIDAMPGGGTLTISTRATDTLVELKVDDTGTGMTDDVRARSMEPFFTTKADGGSGLGLAMVHGIVERHGGQVAVDTELGRGTSFIIRLPTAKAPDDSSPDEEQSEPVEGCRVLVVDDEDHVRGLVSEYLSYDGNTVETAANGQQAIEKLRGDTFDIVITDRGMPLMNGDQLAETVKDVAPEVHVIMLTGVGEMMEDAGEHPEGVDLVVSKPVTEEDLRKAMRQTLGLEASPSTNGTDGPIQHAA